MPTTMTLRERILTALRGGTPDRIPWTVYSWLPPRTKAAVALHRRGLGWVASTSIVHPIHEDVAITEEQHEVAGQELFHVRIETPVGTLTEEATTEPGYGSRWIRKFFISGPEDYGPAEFFFRHTRLEPNYDAWLQTDREIGNGGIVLGNLMEIPIMHLMTAWMGVEGITSGIYDYPGLFDSLIGALDRLYDRQIQLAAEGPAEIIWISDNVTASVISPRVYARYAAPVYARALPILQQAGKTGATHYDGSLRPLLRAIAETDLPVMEAFTPPPMGDLSVAEAKAAWPQKIIWVNFPGCLFVQPFDEIKAYTLGLLREGAPGGRLAIGCTEDFPPGDFEKTFTAIGQALAIYEGRTWQ